MRVIEDVTRAGWGVTTSSPWLAKAAGIKASMAAIKVINLFMVYDIKVGFIRDSAAMRNLREKEKHYRLRDNKTNPGRIPYSKNKYRIISQEYIHTL